MLIVKTRYLMFEHFTWSSFKGRLSYGKIHSRPWKKTVTTAANTVLSRQFFKLFSIFNLFFYLFLYVDDYESYLIAIGNEWTQYNIDNKSKSYE
jgi:hypothetical protein